MAKIDFNEVEEHLSQAGYVDFPDLCCWGHPPFPKDGYGREKHFLFWPFGITYERLYELKQRHECA